MAGQAGLVLGHEGVGDALHAVHGADEGDRSAPADHQAEMSGVLGQLVGVVRVTEVLDGVVQHDVQQGVEPLQSPTGLTAPGKLDSDLLVNKPEEEGEIRSLFAFFKVFNLERHLRTCSDLGWIPSSSSPLRHQTC